MRMRRWRLRVVRAGSTRDPAGGRFTGSGSRAGSVRGAGAPRAVIGPPEIASSEARGTRRSRPNATTGSPWRPSVSRQTRASSYAAVRPIRKTPAASSTVKKSGWLGAVGDIRLRRVVSYEHRHKAPRQAQNQHRSGRTSDRAQPALVDAGSLAHPSLRQYPLSRLAALCSSAVGSWGWPGRLRAGEPSMVSGRHDRDHDGGGVQRCCHVRDGESEEDRDHVARSAIL